MIAALFVDPKGVYAGLPDVEVWDEARDARLYPGPWPVVAHPPCERWGRYWSGGPSAKVRRIKGDDGGCFAAAVQAVERFGGVLEHPEASHAWSAFGLPRPPRFGGWVRVWQRSGWACCVEQGNYGHRARKATWLYAVGGTLPILRWGRSTAKVRLDDGFHSAEERRRAKGLKPNCGPIEGRLGKRERAATPLEFRDVLLEMARSVSEERANKGLAVVPPKR